MPSINPQFKEFISKWYKRTKFLYIVLLHIALAFYSPIVHYDSDKDGTIITIDINTKPYIEFEYHKTLLFSND